MGQDCKQLFKIGFIITSAILQYLRFNIKALKLSYYNKIMRSHILIIVQEILSHFKQDKKLMEIDMIEIIVNILSKMCITITNF